MRPRLIRVLGLAAALAGLRPQLAQIEGAQPASEPTAAPAEEGIRQLGPPLFPLYDHYLRIGDNTEVRTLLFLYHATDRRDPSRPDATRLLFPFYYWERQTEPLDKRLYLFPFGFFHRESEEEAFNVSIPLYYEHRTPRRVFRLLVPLWWQVEYLLEQRSIHRILPPLFKLETERGGPPRGERRARIGIPWLLELFESQAGAAMRRFSAFNFFNWKEETQGGFALLRHEWAIAPDGIEEERTVLFPLYVRSKTPEHDYLIGGPFYGRFAGGDVVRKYYTPFVWRAEGEGGFKSLLAFPFYHRATRDLSPMSYFASYPLFQYERTAEERSWSLFLLLYNQRKVLETGKTRHGILYPLGLVEIEPDRSRGHARVLPFWFDDWNADRRFRFSFPMYWNYQSRSQEEVLWDFTLILPTYVGWGAPRDYFATGFPLYWSSRSGHRGWDLLVPFFFRHNDATSSAFYSLPVSSISRPSLRALSFLAGAATWRRFYDLRGTSGGWALDLLWWLWGFESSTGHSKVRLLPLFATGRDGDQRTLLLFPLLFRQWSPQEAHNYFFPVYGRSRSADGRLSRDFYALGSYARTVELDEAGALSRLRHDALWSLISFQSDEKRHLTHRRVLPLGYWQTRSVPVDRTVAVPFYYSHRISAEEETYRLQLFLGNLFLSRSTERDRPGPPVPIPNEAPPGPPQPAPVGAPPTPAPESKEIVSSEKGVFWPITRWGQTGQQSFEWALPFYYHARNQTEENRAIFPFLYLSSEVGAYTTRYFRYFFLFNRERFEGGNRISVGQLLYDRLADDSKREYRTRLFYPFFELRNTPEGYGYQFTPLCQGEVREEGGERRSNHFFFPVFWKGSMGLKRPDGGYATDTRHFYLFPLYGVSRKSLRTERDFLIPFFHMRRSLDGFAFHFRPLFFLRREPEEFSVRFWPLHSHESAEGAGDWWVTRYLYLSKMAVRRQSTSYRLDPFLVHVHSSRSPTAPPLGKFGTLIAYRSMPTEEGQDTSWHALPFAYGYSRPAESGSGVFPLYYARNFGAKEIDYAVPTRFPFIFNRLKGAGETHSSFLWKAAEYTSRPNGHDFRILQELVVHSRADQARQIAFNPLFSYVRDDGKDTIDWSVLLSLYRYQRTGSFVQRTLFWVIRW